MKTVVWRSAHSWRGRVVEAEPVVEVVWYPSLVGQKWLSRVG